MAFRECGSEGQGKGSEKRVKKNMTKTAFCVKLERIEKYYDNWRLTLLKVYSSAAHLNN